MQLQTTSALELIMQSLKTGRKTSSVALVLWHVVPSYWNQMLPISFSSIFVNKHFLAHFRRKMAQLCLWIKIRNDSFWVSRLFNVCVRVFYYPNATILLVYIKMSFICKDDFFGQKPASFVSRSHVHIAKQKRIGWMVHWLQLLNQLDFIWRHIKDFMQNLSQWWLRNV